MPEDIETYYDGLCCPNGWAIMNLKRKCENYRFKISYQPGELNIAETMSTQEKPKKLPKEERIGIMCANLAITVDDLNLHEVEEELKHETEVYSLNKITMGDIFKNEISFRNNQIAVMEIDPEELEDSDLHWDMIRRETDLDMELRQLRNLSQYSTCTDVTRYLKDEMKSPKIGKEGGSVTPEKISIVEGVVVVNNRPWIPETLRDRTLEILHMGHRGTPSMQSRAKNRGAYWPGMTKDMENVRKECQRCNEHAPSPSEDIKIPPRNQTRPMQMIVADMAELSNHKHILVVADRYSGWVWAYDCKHGGEGE